MSVAQPNLRGKLVITTQASLIYVVFVSLLPIKLVSISGFELTPSLLLSPIFLIWVRSKLQLYMVIYAILLICVGVVGSMLQGNIRNSISAVSSVYVVFYFIAGSVMGARSRELSEFSRPIYFVFLLLGVMILVDFYLNGYRLRFSGSFYSASYSSAEASYISSIFPYYGKFGVLTFASTLLTILYFSIPAILSVASGRERVFGISLAAILFFISFSLMSLQVIVGNLLFFAAVGFGYHLRFGRYLFVAVLVVACVMMVAYWADLKHLLPEFVSINLDQLLSGNLNQVTSGRWEIYQKFLYSIEWHHLVWGCGFCDLNTAFEIGFSSVHFSLLTAVGKGGVALLILLCTPLVIAAYKLYQQPRSISKSIYFAGMLSLLGQSFSWDILQLQVVGPILFLFAGFMFTFRDKPAAGSACRT